MCLYPKLIKNKRYCSTKKNGGVIPKCPDERLKYVTAACGKCLECREQKSRQWRIRMIEEIRENTNAIFVTLTINDESYEKLSKKYNLKEENEIATKALRLWLERVRKFTKKSLKHWFITELGHENTKRLHLHGIIWGEKAKESCQNWWGYGYVFIGTWVNEQTINYIIKYMLKEDKDNKHFYGKVLCSSGLGSSYTNRIDAENNKYKGENTNETYRLRNGTKINLPIYYRNKIYTDEEREKLFLNKIIKGKVWIRGEEIDIKDVEGYNKLLEYHRNFSRLIYGDNEQEWDKEKYLRRLKKQRTATIREKRST
ncbi:MAG: replication initiation protein [Microviridae sp.]|nr:MAG: replication initiation protein [Microviridae sp.]